MGRQKLNNHAQIGQIRDNMVDLVGGKDPSGNALFLQRLGLAKKYKAETEGVGLKNDMLQMRNDATLQAGHEGYDNMQAVNPAQSYQLALALSENKKRPGYLEKQGMMNQAMGMFLPRNPEEQDAAQWAALERGDMGPGGAGVGPKHTEGDLMRAFNLISGKTTGAGDSFTRADKQGLRDSQPRYTLSDQAKANQTGQLTTALLGKNDAEIAAILAKSEGTTNLLEAQALGVGKTTSATASKTGAQETALTAESEETVNLLKQRVVKEQAATWVQRAIERATRNKTRNLDAESGQKLLLLQAQTGVFGAQANAIVASIANKDYESALKGIKTASEAMVTLQLGQAQKEKIAKQMEVMAEEINNLKSTGIAITNESVVRVKKKEADTEKVETEIENLDLQQINDNNESGLIQDNTLADTLFKNTKARGEEWKLYENMNDGFNSGSTKTTDTTDHLKKAMGIQSGKLSAPLQIEDENDSDIKHELQPTYIMELADVMEKKGEAGAFKYLKGLGKNPRAQIHLIAAQFGWTDKKRDKFLKETN